MAKISVIMASKLSPYDFCADRREERFIFAVNSFLKQSHKNSELIIVSDGCEITKRIYSSHFASEKNIQYHEIKSSGYFSGKPRQLGLEKATGDLICYLDSDDFIGENHLSIINDYYDDSKDWCFYNHYYFYLMKGKKSIFRKEHVDYKKRTKMGTCSFVHKKLDIFWPTGYGHDYELIEYLVKNHSFSKLKEDPYYFICHFPRIDLSFDMNIKNMILMNN